jgi:hypothetical protein
VLASAYTTSGLQVTVTDGHSAAFARGMCWMSRHGYGVDYICSQRFRVLFEAQTRCCEGAATSPAFLRGSDREPSCTAL